MNKKNFAILGVAGYAATKHIQTIHAIGGKMVAAVDPNDNVEILDDYFPECEYFKTIDEFTNCLSTFKIDYLVICTPTHLHKEHILFGLNNNINIICESPLVLNTKDFNELIEAEKKSSKKTYTILNYRYNNALKNIDKFFFTDKQNAIEIKIQSYRGNWFWKSWKGTTRYSGGIFTTLGYHIFDILVQNFGNPENINIKSSSNTENAGEINFSNANVSFSFNYKPINEKNQISKTITINGNKIDINHKDSIYLIDTYNDILYNKSEGICNISQLVKLVETFNKIKNEKK